MLYEAAKALYEEIKGWSPSTWSITTSESKELDLSILAKAAGTFYVTDSSDPNGLVHPVHYVGTGLTTSKGCFDFVFGGSYSTTDMTGGGVGSIYMKPGKGSLSMSDLFGSGCIISAAVTAPEFRQPSLDKPPDSPMEAWGVSIIFFGAPPLLTDAIGLAYGRQVMLPGAGATWLPCVFSDPGQPRQPRKATLPQSQFGSGGTTPQGGVTIPKHSPTG